MKEFSWSIVKGLIPYFIILFAFMILLAVFYKIKNTMKTKINQKIASVKTDGGVCPKCGGVLIMRDGKYGRFLGCSNFPKCRYTEKNTKLLQKEK